MSTGWMQIRSALAAVYQEAGGPVEKRLAAYMVLMRNPERGLLGGILSALRDESDEQLKSFVWSHLNNIRQSTQPQLEQWVLTTAKHKYVCTYKREYRIYTRLPVPGFSCYCS